MDKKVDIHKAAGILIKDRKIAVFRQKGLDTFMAPGGRLESGETSREAVLRELKEECTLEVAAVNLTELGTFYAQAALQEDKYLRMDIFLISGWEGELQPSGEIEEIRWINSSTAKGMKLGSVIEHEVLPRLKKEDMID